jgi:hypothetical protein
MLTPRRRAQLVIAAASFTLVCTFTILIAGSSDRSVTPKASETSAPSRITPLATGQLGMSGADDSRFSLDR